MADERVWTIEPALYEENGTLLRDEEVTVQHLAGELTELAPILARLGGVVTIAARRTQVAENLYKTTSVVVVWNQHAPLAKKQRGPEPVHEPPSDPQEGEPVVDENQPEPVAAG